jgi:hypothetical protein
VRLEVRNRGPERLDQARSVAGLAGHQATSVIRRRPSRWRRGRRS